MTTLIEFAQQMEEHHPAQRAERQIAELIKDHEIKLGQAFSKMPRFAFCFFQFKCIDQFNGREEAHLTPVMFDGLDADCCGCVALARSGTADQNNILGRFDKLASV